MFFISGTLPLPELRRQAAALAEQAFRPGTRMNHRMQARVYKQFCADYGFPWRQPTEDILILYITYLVGKFQSAVTVRNYFSGVRFLFKDRGQEPPAFTSHHVAWQLRAADLTMRTPPSPKLPITPQLLAQLCELCPSLGPLGPAMRVALTFGFFGMLRQSNLAPAAAIQFDPTRHTCRGDVVTAAPGLVVRVKWTKAQQSIGDSTYLPLPMLPGHPADPVEAHRLLLRHSPTTSAMQPLLTVHAQGAAVAVTIPQLAQALKLLLGRLGVSDTKYSLHSLRRGGCTTAYKQDVPYVDVKRHGNWASDAFWGYVASPQVAHSKVAAALRRAVAP